MTDNTKELEQKTMKNEEELKNELEKYEKEANNPIITTTYNWSITVNKTIADMVFGIPPFPFVRESLIKMIEKAIINHEIDEGELPDSLIEINVEPIVDPWGRPYQYLRLDGGKTKGINGKRRRDKNANPVNSDFDLYSMGRDGKTVAQFTAKAARDDIVRAFDGAYYGLAGNH